MISARVYRNGAIEDLAKALRTDPRLQQNLISELDQEFRRNEERLFVTEGASGGKRWPALSPEYAKRKAGLRRRDRREAGIFRRLGFSRGPTIAGRTILTLGGGLRGSLTRPSSPDHIAEVIPGPKLRIGLGTRHPLAHYHFEGAPPLPRRDPIQHTEQQKQGYLVIARDFFLARVRAAYRNGQAAGAKVPA